MSRLVALLITSCALLVNAGCGGENDLVTTDVTFSRDVAPIVFQNCSPCHRPGESGPFSLLTYTDVRKRARQIVEVTESRYMPPWKPEPGYGEFLGARGLSAGQIVLLRRWVDRGAPEGDPEDLPALPSWPEGWQLGEPDLEVEMPQPYTLPAGDGDVFRNFVIPLPLDGRRYVKAVELRPGNPRLVHHAVIMMDPTGAARKRAASEPEPGFGGMDVGEVQRPGGHFLGWAPGTMPYAVSDSLAWVLEPGADLVLQLHMLPSGKPETVQVRVGFFFSEKAPTHIPLLLRLGRKDIDIPAGASQYAIADSYLLPAAVDVLTVYPHAHYLGETMEAYATLPDGDTQWLLRIDDWDFNWQDYYRYARPVSLPRGTTVHMRYTYNNSRANPRNPHDPPQRVRYGTQSWDEMGDLIIQVLPPTRADGDRLRRDYSRHWLRQEIEGYESLLTADPDNADHHHVLGLFYLASGAGHKAARHLQAALKLRPDFPEAHLNMATVMVRAQKFREAEQHLRRALDLRPEYGDAHLNLGMLLVQMRRGEEALPHLESAARMRPDLAADIGRVLAGLRREGTPRRQP